MAGRAGNAPLPKSALDDEWQALRRTAIVATFEPGEENWLQLVSVFKLPSTTLFPIGIAVAPGTTWHREFERFSLELVRLVPNLDYPELTHPNCSRARVFHHDKPVTISMLRPISPLIPDRPCIEEVRIENEVYIDVRGVQNIDAARWSEEILSLLRGAWLITRDNNLLTEGELRYEAEISSAIEAMANRGHERSSPPRFTKSSFAAHWPAKMSRPNIYNIVPEYRWDEIELRYYRRWRELEAG